MLQLEGHIFAQDVSTQGGDSMALRRIGPTSEVALSGTPSAGQVAYLHTDHLGAVVKATDEAQNVVWDAVRKPFGERTLAVGQVEVLLEFPGQYFDGESGNFYNYFRDYDATTGRYLQSDPIGLMGGLNTYAYVGSNSVNWIDPLGLEVLVCNRKVNGFPFVGNHAYPWDTATNSAEGMRGSSGSGADANEKGPSADSCNAVEGSSGKEKEIMDFMRKNQNNGIWFPGINDCHNAVQDAVENSGLNYPGAPGGRFGSPTNSSPSTGGGGIPNILMLD